MASDQTYRKAERDFCIDHHEEMTAEDLAAALNVDTQTIYNLCRRLRITPKKKKYTRKVAPPQSTPGYRPGYTPRLSKKKEEPDPRPPAEYSNTGYLKLMSTHAY